MKTRTVVIVLVVVGVLGLCLVGSCLSLGLLAAVSEDSTTRSNEVTPPAADDEAPSTGTRYQCMATGMVNKCVAPGRCTFMTVSGVGSGEDRRQASEMARIACQGQAIAMGGSATCMVACTPK